MPTYIRIFFYSFLFAPFYAYLISNELLLVPYYVLGSTSLILLLFLVTQKKIHIPSYIYPLILFAVYYSVWDFFNGRFEQFGMIKLLFKNYPLHIVAVLLIIENIKFDKIFIKNILNGLSILLVLSFIFTLIQVFIDPNYFTTEAANSFELSSFSYQIRNTAIWGYLSPLDVGLSFLPILAIILGYTKSNKLIFKFFIFLTIGTVVAILTNSRWILVNMLIIFFPLIFTLKGKKIKTALITVLSLIVVIVTINNIFNFLGFDFTTYLEGRILNKSSQSRFLAIELFEEFFPRKPIFGTGVRVETELNRALAGRSSQIHVGYLSNLYEFGIVGSTFLFLFWFMLFRSLYKNAKVHKQNFLIYGFACFLLANLTLVEYSIFHIGLLYIIIFDRFYFNNISNNPLRGVNK